MDKNYTGSSVFKANKPKYLPYVKRAVLITAHFYEYVNA